MIDFALAGEEAGEGEGEVEGEGKERLDAWRVGVGGSVSVKCVLSTDNLVVGEALGVELIALTNLKMQNRP